MSTLCHLALLFEISHVSIHKNEHNAYRLYLPAKMLRQAFTLPFWMPLSLRRQGERSTNHGAKVSIKMLNAKQLEEKIACCASAQFKAPPLRVQMLATRGTVKSNAPGSP